MKLIQSPARPQERGTAVIVVVVLLGIMMLYVAANIRSLSNLHTEIKQVEQEQLRHWQKVRPAGAPKTVTPEPVQPVN